MQWRKANDKGFRNVKQDFSTIMKAVWIMSTIILTHTVALAEG